jgi:KEOPS complex subunit Pcc1
VTSRKSTSRSPHEAVFSLRYPDAESARRVERAIDPEAGDIQGDRTRARLSREDDTLEVSIQADDLVALRAGLNTWTTLVAVAEEAGGVEP